MSSATAGQKRTHKRPLFTTEGFVSIFTAIGQLRSEGFAMVRAHKKLADASNDAQLMLVFEKGPAAAEFTSKEIDSLTPFFGTADGMVAGCSWIVRAHENAAIPKTSEIHLGVPAHILLSCSEPAERQARDNELRLTPADKFRQVTQVRIALNMSAELAEMIPSWVDERPWNSSK
jgi:hypothetical protein